MGDIFTTKATGAQESLVNSTNVVEVTTELPATLVANTTYIVRGSITQTTAVTCTVEGVSIIGYDRFVDKITWTPSAGTIMLTITDVNFTISELCLSATNTSTSLISATNFNASNYNSGRIKVLTILNCQFRNAFDLIDINGYDLVDIQQSLFWYCQPSNFGVRLTNTSKTELTSCEFIRWFAETNTAFADYALGSYVVGDKVNSGGIFYNCIVDANPLNPPSSTSSFWEEFGYATVPMVDFVHGTVSFGATNIGTSIFHPQVLQQGIRIDPQSSTGFGTISSNTFITTGLVPNKQIDTLTLSGTSGTANVLVNGNTYLATFNTNLTTTASDFVTAYASEVLNKFQIVLTSSSADLIFTSQNTGDVFAVKSIVNAGSGDLSGTIVNTNPAVGVVANFDYSTQGAFIIQANQGLQNANAKGTMTLSDNIVLLDNSVTNPIALAVASTVGGGGFTNPITFPTGNRVLTNATNGSLTYVSKLTANFFVIVSAFVERSGDGFVEMRLRSNGTAITTQVGRTEIRQSRAESLTFSVLGTAKLGDVFDIEVECQDTSGSPTGIDVLVRDLTLNGYQF